MCQIVCLNAWKELTKNADCCFGLTYQSQLGSSPLYSAGIRPMRSQKTVDQKVLSMCSVGSPLDMTLMLSGGCLVFEGMVHLSELLGCKDLKKNIVENVIYEGV